MHKTSVFFAVILGLTSTCTLATTILTSTSPTNNIGANHSTAIAALSAQPHEQNSLAALFNATSAHITQNPTGTFSISLKPINKLFLMCEHLTLGPEVNHISIVSFAAFANNYATDFGFKNPTAKISDNAEIQLAGTITITTTNGNLVSFAPQIIKYNKAKNLLLAEKATIVGDTTIDLKDALTTKGEVSVAFTSAHWEPTNESELNTASYTHKPINGEKSSTMVIRNLEAKDLYQNHVMFFLFKKPK